MPCVHPLRGVITGSLIQFLQFRNPLLFIIFIIITINPPFIFNLFYNSFTHKHKHSFIFNNGNENAENEKKCELKVSSPLQKKRNAQRGLGHRKDILYFIYFTYLAHQTGPRYAGLFQWCVYVNTFTFKNMDPMTQ